MNRRQRRKVLHRVARRSRPVPAAGGAGRAAGIRGRLGGVRAPMPMASIESARQAPKWWSIAQPRAGARAEASQRTRPPRPRRGRVLRAWCIRPGDRPSHGANGLRALGRLACRGPRRACASGRDRGPAGRFRRLPDTANLPISNTRCAPFPASPATKADASPAGSRAAAALPVSCHAQSVDGRYSNTARQMPWSPVPSALWSSVLRWSL